MEVTSIQNGIIIDHVPAGTALKVLEYLKIDPSKTRLALIMNADSHLYGTKDIIKIEDEESTRCSISCIRSVRSTAATTATRKPSSDLTPVVSRFRTSSPGGRNRGPAGATVFIRANFTRRCIC